MNFHTRLHQLDLNICQTPGLARPTIVAAFQAIKMFNVVIGQRRYIVSTVLGAVVLGETADKTSSQLGVRETRATSTVDLKDVKRVLRAHVQRAAARRPIKASNVDLARVVTCLDCLPALPHPAVNQVEKVAVFGKCQKVEWLGGKFDAPGSRTAWNACDCVPVAPVPDANEPVLAGYRKGRPI
jgi:NACalpha-BTF3-like transcription factor